MNSRRVYRGHQTLLIFSRTAGVHLVSESNLLCRVFDRGGAKVVIDELSLNFLAGSTIDYHQELIRSSFRIIANPNAELACSCGASFALK